MSGQECPKRHQEISKRPQDIHKKLPRNPKRIQEAPKRPPRCFQEAPGGHQRKPSGPKRSKRPPIEDSAPRCSEEQLGAFQKDPKDLKQKTNHTASTSKYPMTILRPGRGAMRVAFETAARPGGVEQQVSDKYSRPAKTSSGLPPRVPQDLQDDPLHHPSSPQEHRRIP